MFSSTLKKFLDTKVQTDDDDDDDDLLFRSTLEKFLDTKQIMMMMF